ncbi:MAG: hypothetical protein LBC74_06815, partial [Planctomycetaceae bacterium]|nr:hypothetical protein [Planctomycetaceae bacterium]
MKTNKKNKDYLLQNSLIYFLVILFIQQLLSISCMFGQSLERPPKNPYQLSFDVKYSDYFLSENLPQAINFFNEELKTYRHRIEEADENLIMLRYPQNWHKIIKETSEIINLSYEGRLITFSDKSVIGVDIIINNSTQQSLHDTVLKSAKMFLFSSRQSTWSDNQILRGIRPHRLDFQRTNFVSHYYPLDFENHFYINSQNITIVLYVNPEKYVNRKEAKITPHITEQNVVKIVNSITSLFIEQYPESSYNGSKHINSNDMLLRVLNAKEQKYRHEDYCEIEWEIKNSLLQSWVLIHATHGTISILSPDKSLFSHEREKALNGNKKFEDSTCIHKGKISLKNMLNKETILTMYAITADGKTWYKRQIKIDPKELLTIASEVYRKWKSFDDQ